MPVIIGGKVKKRNRRKHFDASVASLAPMIRKFQAEGVRDIRALATRLTLEGITASSGRPFTYATMWRVLVRADELGLAEGPRSLSIAATQRAYQFKPEKSANAKKALKALIAASKDLTPNIPKETKTP